MFCQDKALSFKYPLTITYFFIGSSIIALTLLLPLPAGSKQTLSMRGVPFCFIIENRCPVPAILSSKAMTTLEI